MHMWSIQYQLIFEWFLFNFASIFQLILQWLCLYNHISQNALCFKITTWLQTKMWTRNLQKCQWSWWDNRNRGKTTDEIPCILLLQKRETAIWPSPYSRRSCVKLQHKNIFFAFQTASPACRWYPSLRLYCLFLTFMGLFPTRACLCLKPKCTISITLTSSEFEKD